jgi:hypothetical protein
MHVFPRGDYNLCAAWLEAAAAHRLQEENTLNKAGSLSGKIVLTPAPQPPV